MPVAIVTSVKAKNIVPKVALVQKTVSAPSQQAQLPYQRPSYPRRGGCGCGR